MKTHLFICAILLAVEAAAAPLLSLDFNHRTNSTPAATQPGFIPFLITSNLSIVSPQTNATMRMIGPYRVTPVGDVYTATIPGDQLSSKQ